MPSRAVTLGCPAQHCAAMGVGGGWAGNTSSTVWGFQNTEPAGHRYQHKLLPALPNVVCVTSKEKASEGGPELPPDATEREAKAQGSELRAGLGGAPRSQRQAPVPGR